MAADALAPCVAKASAAMILTLNDKQILVFNKKFFDYVDQPNAEELLKLTMYFHFFQRNSACQELIN